MEELNQHIKELHYYVSFLERIKETAKKYGYKNEYIDNFIEKMNDEIWASESKIEDINHEIEREKNKRRIGR